jgi:hypothetical protein
VAADERSVHVNPDNSIGHRVVVKPFGPAALRDGTRLMPTVSTDSGICPRRSTRNVGYS